MMLLDRQAGYDRLVQSVGTRIQEIVASSKPMVGNVGCIAVTARLAKLPTTVEGLRQVNADFFTKAED